MSSILGEQTAKFESGGNTVDLLYCIVSPNFNIPASIMHQSILTGHRTYSRNERFMSFIVADYLFKYDDPQAKADEILDYENTLVNFYPFIDGAENINVIFEDIKIKSLDENDPTRKDVAIITFVSELYAKLFTNKMFIDEDGFFFEDEDGVKFTDG